MINQKDYCMKVVLENERVDLFNNLIKIASKQNKYCSHDKERQKRFISIIEMRMDGLSLDFIAKKLNLSRERVRQIEMMMLKSIRTIVCNLNIKYEHLEIK